MAISQMKKLSIILEQDILDQFLQFLQQRQAVEVRNVCQLDEWQEAFQERTDTCPKIWQFADKSEGNLEGNQTLAYFRRQEEEIKDVIKALTGIIPPKSKLATLKKQKPSIQFEDLEDLKRQKEVKELLCYYQEKIQRLKTINQALEGLDVELEDLRKWEQLKIVPRDLADLNVLAGQIGTIPSTADDSFYRQLLANPHIVLEKVFQTELEYGVLLFWDKQQTVALEDYHFKALDYPYQLLPAELLLEKEKAIKAYKAEKEQLVLELSNSADQMEELYIQLDYCSTLNLRQSAKQLLARSCYLVAIEAWIEADQVRGLEMAAQDQFGCSVYIQATDVEQAEWDEVPIKLRNHTIIEPFELVTEMYALPKYYEKDPTPLLAPFYFTFFGMMVADLGYGLLLGLVASLALNLGNLDVKKRRFLKFFRTLGVAVALWGLIYGSFFGFGLPVHLLSTTRDVMSILILSVIFGFVTVIVGLLLNGLQQVKMRDYAQAYSSGFAWCLILVGLFLMAIGLLIPWLGFLITTGKWLAIVNAIGIVLVAVLKSKNFAGLGVGLYQLYNISSYIGDLVSFTRLMALGLSGASIGSAFNLIVSIFPPLGRFTIGIVIFVFLHAINIFLSLLSGYVHGARLMFVEFFGKFYQGGGRAFNPLKVTNQYVVINKESQMEEE
ncbi:V-type ATP synthase subunit I [Streptococcus porcinus]